MANTLLTVRTLADGDRSRVGRNRLNGPTSRGHRVRRVPRRGLQAPIRHYTLVAVEEIGRVVFRLYGCQSVPGRPRIGLAHAQFTFVSQEAHVCARLPAPQSGR